MKHNFSKVLWAALAIVLFAAMTSACSEKDNAIWWSDVPNVYGAENHAATLELEQTLQLSATPTDKGLQWMSNNERVATVSDDGLVTAVGLGEAIINVYPKIIEGAANGNYVIVTVVDKSIGFVDDLVDQSEAE